MGTTSGCRQRGLGGGSVQNTLDAPGRRRELGWVTGDEGPAGRTGHFGFSFGFGGRFHCTTKLEIPATAVVPPRRWRMAGRATRATLTSAADERRSPGMSLTGHGPEVIWALAE